MKMMEKIAIVMKKSQLVMESAPATDHSIRYDLSKPVNLSVLKGRGMEILLEKAFSLKTERGFIRKSSWTNKCLHPRESPALRCLSPEVQGSLNLY
ncbi:hypothetical protein D9X91_22135 [Falsibacillus albus]|uniref:Uncharacterized protein n=1 Tax=Falsibacillus albus TaxID=2478915 RepID=A0A3L7JJY4_9BACI|nr:hypothetical protein D9X91_22135 [Falsibacillus albus]